jgi:protein TonB
LLFILTVKAQLPDSARKSSEKAVTVEYSDPLFVSVEHPPEYPGGISKFYKFLAKYLRYPTAARENNTQGRVLVTMVVEKDGSLSDVHVVRGIGSNCDEEAVRLVKLSAPWKPGVQNGRAVRVQYTLPVTFEL